MFEGIKEKERAAQMTLSPAVSDGLYLKEQAAKLILFVGGEESPRQEITETFVRGVQPRE